MEMNHESTGATQMERRHTTRPPTGPRYKRLRREVDVPELIKEVGFVALKPQMLIMMGATFALVWYLLA